MAIVQTVDDIEIRAVRTPTTPYGGRMANTAAAVAAIFAPMYEGLTREKLIAVYTDSQNIIMGYSLVGAGTADRAPAHAREVFGPALVIGAVKIILMHNHPTGNAEPSASDLQLTRRMRETGELIGIPVVDHIIMGGRTATDYVSMHERGYCG